MKRRFQRKTESPTELPTFGWIELLRVGLVTVKSVTVVLQCGKFSVLNKQMVGDEDHGLVVGVDKKKDSFGE